MPQAWPEASISVGVVLQDNRTPLKWTRARGPCVSPETTLVSVDRGAFQDGSAATFR